jgi:hypothetical protein
MATLTIFLDDRLIREGLQPFTLTRHVADIRIGIFTIREKWMKYAGAVVVTEEGHVGAVRVPANWLPAPDTCELILDACRSGNEKSLPDVKALEHPWQIFEWNSWALQQDFEWIGRNGSGEFDNSNHFINRENIIIEAGARVSHSILNADEGPIYIAANSRVMEGCLIRGPFAMLGGSVLKMGTRIYGATTLGPYCTAGGEIKNSVFFGYSNKAHDGYLGDSVIGAWCNLGAGTSNSNIKNNASTVKYKLAADREPVSAGIKAGLLMGDYSRCAINTSFNTGSVVGVCCNIFGNEMPPAFTDHFSWGAVGRYDLEKSFTDIQNWKRLKGQDLSGDERSMLRKLYQTSNPL